MTFKSLWEEAHQQRSTTAIGLGCNTYIHENTNDGIQHNKYSDRNYLYSEVLDFEDTVILGQNAELDQSNRERVDHLVCIPVFQGGDQDHSQV